MSFDENRALPTTVAGTTVPQTTFSWWGTLETIVLFVFILIVCLWILKRLNRANVRSMSAPWAKLLDRQTLGGQQMLYLVEIAGQLQVLGGSDHHLVKISEINDPKVASEILEEIAQRPTERVEGWSKHFKKLLQKKSKRKETFSTELERLLQEVEE